MSKAQSVEKIVGNLKEWPLEEIIESLAATSKTGLIQISNSHIWFHQGAIYLVETPNSPKLSAVLFNADVGTLAEIEGRFTSPLESGSVIDQLMAEYPNSSEQLKLVVNEYNLSGLLELLLPSEGEFVIMPEKLHRLGHTLAQDANQFVRQCKQRLSIWKNIATAVPSTDAVFVLQHEFPEGAPKRTFSADEWKFISRLDGNNTVEDLVIQTQDSAFRVCTSLYRLMLEGVVVEKA